MEQFFDLMIPASLYVAVIVYLVTEVASTASRSMRDEH